MFAPVVADVDAPVVTVDQVVGPLGVDPERVVVGVHVVTIDPPPGLTAVVAAYDRYAKRIHPGRVVSGRSDLTEVVAVGVVQTVNKFFVRPLPRFAVSRGNVKFKTFDRRIKQQGVGVFEVLNEHLWVDAIARYIGKNRVCRQVFRETAAA